jgi:hypothetical protein
VPQFTILLHWRVEARDNRGMNYDPKLKELARRIEDLCKEYDAGAHISLVSRTHGEFRFCLPDWAGLYEEVEPATGNVRIRLKIKKAEGDTFEKAELTAHLLHSLRDTAASCFAFVDQFIKVTDEKWQTEHKPFHGFRPHREEH